MEEIKKSAEDSILNAGSIKDLEDIRVKYMGKKGEITSLMKNMGSLSNEEKPAYGQAINNLKDHVNTLLDNKKSELNTIELNARLQDETLDVTLPPYETFEGSIHPVTQTIEEIISIFGEMGFTVAEGPNIEDDWHNFTALNIPEYHPARQEHDTFYLPADENDQRFVLRTHTSPVQIRTMETQKPPFRVICPGRTYRSDSDATHTPMFHQVEMIVVEENVNFAHLKGCIIEFCRKFFGVDDLPVRFRPSFFPFTEPSAEVDIGCSKKDGALKIGGGDDWLEILGSGMIHPNVLKNAGLDPEKYQGFALGMGIERIAMLKYGIADLRTFYDSDLRWLRHYGFKALQQPNLLRGE